MNLFLNNSHSSRPSHVLRNARSKKLQSIAVSVCLVSAQIFAPIAARAQQAAPEAQAFKSSLLPVKSISDFWTQDLSDNARTNAALQRLRSEYLRRHLRTPLDAKVMEILTSDARYNYLYLEIKKAAELQAQEYSKQMAYGTVEVNQEQTKYTWFGEIVVKLAKTMGIPDSVVQKMRLFVQQSPEPNAYVYSAEGEIHGAAISSLLEFGKEPVTAVFGHELGHVLSSHIAMQMSVQAIFDATWEIIIPDVAADPKAGPEGEKKKELMEARAKVKASIRQASLHSLAHMAAGMGAHREGAKSNIGVEFAEGYLSATDGVVKNLVSQVKDNPAARRQLKQLAANLLSTLLSSDPKGEKLTPQEAMSLFSVASLTAGDMVNGTAKGAPQDPEQKKELIKKFQEAVARLSRAMEQTSDNHSIVYVGVRPTQLAFASLLGGTPEGILQQAANRNEHSGALVTDFAMGEGSSHPGITARVQYPEIYAKSLDYLVLTDPVFNFINYYLDVSAYHLKNKRSIEVEKLPHEAEYAAQNLKFIGPHLAQARTALLNEISNELAAFNSAKPSLRTLESFILYFEKVTSSNYSSRVASLIKARLESLTSELGKADGVVGMVNELVQKSTLPEPVKKSVFERLNKIVPIVSAPKAPSKSLEEIAAEASGKTGAVLKTCYGLAAK